MWIKAWFGIPAVGMKAGKQFERYRTVTINCYCLSNDAAQVLSWSRGGNGFCGAAAAASFDRLGIVDHMFHPWLRKNGFTAKCLSSVELKACKTWAG
ncbi:uncharacterized [Tachysurus ichikawai]